jgi:hypothetical protein
MKDPKTKEKRKNRKKLGHKVTPVNNFDPKTFARWISKAAIGAVGGELIYHSPCGPVLFKSSDADSGWVKIRIRDKHERGKQSKINKFSVADPGCLSRILIFTHHGSRIRKQQKERGLGAGIRKKPIPDPGSRGQKAAKPGSATLE